MSKPLKLFISYSHMDEELLKQFVPHLSVLKRINVLETWFDRELIAGDQFDKEIEKNLVAADLVAFLVSADFLHSWYCYEKELKTALAKAEHSQVRIIPIIVRPCDWQDTDLGGYLAATRDGKPITTSGNRDEAWLEVVRSIRRAAETLLNREDVSSGDSVCPDSIEPELAEKFDQILDSTEIQFSSRFKANIDLKDIFVPPDLKNLKREYDDIENTVPAFNIVNNVEKFPRVVILGAEQYGKTSLAKTYFRKSLGAGALALLCDAKSIKSSDFSVVQKKLVLSQYVTPSPSDFTRSQAKKVLIVDDYDALGLNLRFQKSLLETFSTIFDQVILIAGTSLRFDEDRLVDLSGFSQYEILPFGNVKRGELIDRWNSLGREQTVDLRDLHNDNDRLTADVDAIIRKNILPKAPIYILTIIQLLETSAPSDYTLTSYGHCYQSLIQKSLEKSRVRPQEFDLYINYLTELAYFIFLSSSEAVDDDGLESFQKEYSRRYLVDSHDVVVRSLLSAGILRRFDGNLGFGYRYIYYFYVAKFLAEHVLNVECKAVISRLCENLHTERNANILIFLVHHTKDRSIVEEIMLYTEEIFERTAPARLDKEETHHLLDYIASIPELVLEQKDVEESRRKRLERKDAIEEIEDDIDGETEERDRGVLVEINKSARTVEIIGQILRNRHGSLEKLQLRELVLTACGVGLRFLTFFLEATKREQELILDYIQNAFKENTSMSDEKVAKEARRLFLMLCYGTSFSVIRKLSEAIGSDKLMPIFEELNATPNQSAAMHLVYVAAKMEFTKSIPRKELGALFSDLSGNPIAQRLLQELVIQHLYLNHVEYQDRQWISEKIRLPMKAQRRLQDDRRRKL